MNEITNKPLTIIHRIPWTWEEGACDHITYFGKRHWHCHTKFIKSSSIQMILSNALFYFVTLYLKRKFLNSNWEHSLAMNRSSWIKECNDKLFIKKLRSHLQWVHIEQHFRKYIDICKSVDCYLISYWLRILKRCFFFFQFDIII